ncbi:TrkA family potassium uptake protein [candidate division KSB1 bacterium]|nr:TrkA family potassium uptake protein [candidate division KSB1 bacterium]
MAEKQSLYVIIVGCGRLGSYLANTLSRSGHSVVVIDNSEAAFNNLSTGFGGFQIIGDVSEFSVLKQAKIERADVLIATTKEDNLNIMIAQIAQKFFSVPKVMARVYDPKREKIYREFGIETISPTSIAGNLFLESLIFYFHMKLEGLNE